MADSPAVAAPLSIAALPQTTARQLGSGQVLVDPSSIVKELIDNALDARAKSIFVDISTNTIDSIQVKDDGHGVPSEDRAVLCRRHYTSKIREFHDLKHVGAKWLGFRGEALASMAEMSGSLSITTRVEGEPVAVLLKYGRDGELVSTQRVSHPVGTTVNASHVLERHPVRKQMAVKNASKYLSKVRRLMMAYAFARPAVRFRLHVLKAKTTKGDLMYAPKMPATVEDCVLKILGKECALQCHATDVEAKGIHIHALLPKPTANCVDISNLGAFVSVDARPVSNNRMTFKRITSIVRERLRKVNASMSNIKEPFFCINIKCPPDSYDPNVEPAKDDVLFNDTDVVLAVVNQLLEASYPENAIDTDSTGPPTSARPIDSNPVEELRHESLSPVAVDEDPREEDTRPGQDVLHSEQSKWRSSMYGIDEDDLDFLQEDQPPIIEEEDDTRAAEVSNPWTIARMNAPIKSKGVVSNGQLLSPAKSCSERQLQSSSPMSVYLRPREFVEPLVHQPTVRMSAPVASSDRPLDLTTPTSPETLMSRSVHPFDGCYRANGAVSSIDRSGLAHSQNVGATNNHMDVDSLLSKIPRRGLRKQHSSKDQSQQNLEDRAQGTWFGQPMQGSRPSQPRRRQARNKPPTETPLSPSNQNIRSQFPTIAAAENLMNGSLSSQNNADIRDYFRHQSQQQRNEHEDFLAGSSFTAINAVPRTLCTSVNDTAAGSREYLQQHRASLRNLSIGDNDASPSAKTFDNPHKLPMRGLNLGMRDASTSHNAAPASINYGNGLSCSAVPRSSSVGSERALILPERSNSPMIASNLRQNHRQPSITDDNNALFRAYELHPAMTLNQAIAPSQKHASSNVVAARLTKTAQPVRRRTTDGAQRPKSSHLPLERVPHGFRIQNIVLSISLGVASIIQTARKIDMAHNWLDWDVCPETILSAFLAPVTETRITSWVHQIDYLLHRNFEKVPGVDTCSLLHETIQRGIDTRFHDQIVEPANAELISDGSVRPVGRQAHHVKVTEAQGQTSEVPRQVSNEMSDFDMSQYVDIDDDDGVMDDDASGVAACAEVAEDFANEVDDDMLLDI